MRHLTRSCLFFLLCPLLAWAGEAKISRVWTDFRTTESFERIGEYFGGQEKHHGRVVLRTQAQDRNGFYFLIRVDDLKTLTPGCVWRVALLRPNKTETETFNFPLGTTPPQPVFELGLTGSDWSDAKATPTAWKVTLLDSEGRELLSKQSFLWH